MTAREPRLAGVGPGTAARQAAALLALAAVLAVVGAATTPDRAGYLLAVAAGDALAAAAGWWLPWRRWGPLSPLALAVPSFVVLGFSTWAFGGMAAGTGPFFVLIFAWAGLNFPRWAILALVPPAAVAYVAPLVATGQPAPVVTSAVVLLPIAVGIALLLVTQVAHQRRDRDRIARAERWRAALAATLAHDLRSPLTAVRLVLESVRIDDDLPTDQRDRLLDNAVRQVDRMTALTGELLDAERVDAGGGLRLDLEDVPLADAVREALRYLSAGDIAVTVDPGLVVRADPRRLEQMLVNLTSNALRHGRPPVTVQGRAVDGHARVEVRDHGPGVPSADRGQLFTRFGPTNRDSGSVGLGLWIVASLAHAHGGAVSYEPAEPGARMVLTLPLGSGPALRADRAEPTGSG
ncbi:MAG TPA: HAMP domain-containing sensor histidine kinase [Pilimelia sp.]|nr:HAMP domain-containing sensor histidine kinase [Pilimelia sp.]